MHNDNTYRTETPLMTALFVASELGVRVPIPKERICKTWCSVHFLYE